MWNRTQISSLTSPTATSPSRGGPSIYTLKQPAVSDVCPCWTFGHDPSDSVIVFWLYQWLQSDQSCVRLQNYVTSLPGRLIRATWQSCERDAVRSQPTTADVALSSSRSATRYPSQHHLLPKRIASTGLSPYKPDDEFNVTCCRCS